MKENELKLIQDRIDFLNKNIYLLQKNIFVNWFFPVKPHPFYLKKYEKLNKNKISLFFSLFKNFLKILIIFIANIFKPISRFINMKDTNYEYVFISHHISNKKIFDEDSYYKDVFKTLKENKIKFLKVYLNHKIKMNKEILINEDNYYFLEKNSTIGIEITCLIETFKLFLFYIKLKELSVIEKLIIISEVFSSDTYSNLRINFQIKNLFKKINFKKLICTFEGFNFEKIIFSQSKSKNINIKNIGIQHASIIKNQNSIYKLQNTNFFPDFIFTSGIYYEKLFKTKIINNTVVKTIGSNKFNFTNYKNYNKENLCLVLPEAILSECNILFNFTLKYLKKYDNLKFIWRLHPLMNINETLKKLSINNFSSEKIILSSNYDEDFFKSKYCLYRGSTSVIQSIKYSITPLYLDIKKDFNIDPIIDLNLNNSINSIDDLYNKTRFENSGINIEKLSFKINEYFEKPKQNILNLL